MSSFEMALACKAFLPSCEALNVGLVDQQCWLVEAVQATAAIVVPLKSAALVDMVDEIDEALVVVAVIAELEA